MDEVTQQNAVLVEEAAAASEAMQDQAAKLAEIVSIFKVEGMRPASVRPAGLREGAGAPKVPARTAHTAPMNRPVRKPEPRRLAIAKSGSHEDWGEF